MDGAACWAPQGRALLAYLEGDQGATIEVHGEGEVDPVPAAHFFRDEGGFEDWERLALDACRGRVLDLGAGAGAHALALQRRGAEVTALDVDPLAVEVMARRGVRAARCGTLAEVEAASHDTLLMLMHGVGLVGDTAGLAWFLADARRVLAHGGQLLLDSRGPAGGGAAVAELQLAFRGERGAPFLWLFIDAEALAEQARSLEMDAQVLWCDDQGGHLTRLVPR